jgi:LysR family transcriptional activator of nhaA
MSQFNYHHLHSFWTVARNGNLTNTALQLHVSQSALSTQIRQLEEYLGQDLFTRKGRRMVLTEAGQIALAYADQVFAAGNELVATLRDGHHNTRQVLRIGAVSTLSRNFQEGFIKPLLQRDDVELVMQSGGLTDLLTRMEVHTLDLVLSNRRVHADAQHPWRCQRIARQQVSLIGKPRRRRRPFRFPEDLHGLPVIVPGADSEVRASFDMLCDQLALRVNITAAVDDMAMLRVLARSAPWAVVVPTVVVRDEIRAGTLEEYCVLPNLHEDFFAISIRRKFQHPLLKELLARKPEDVLGMP